MRWQALGFVALLTGLVGCATNPVTGKTDLSLISPEQELALGRQHYGPNQQAQGGAYLVDPDLNVYVRSVGNQLAAVSDRSKLPFEFVVLNNDLPNAWALPGGKIAVNRGLLYLLEDESQLAAVLGHEIVHAAARHSAQQMSQQILLGTGLQVLAAASQNTEYGALANQGAQLGVAAWSARYSRGNELEADRYGMTYMARAGYEPQGAVELQQAFVALSEGQGGGVDQLFASHPPSRERVAANQTLAASLPRGNRNQAQFRRAMAKLLKDKPAYDQHQQAMAAANKKDYAQALTLTEQAIKRQPREAHFWLTKARLLEQRKDQGAASAYDQAVRLAPEFYAPLLYRGSYRFLAKQYDLARADLAHSETLLPTAQASFYLAEIHLARGEQQQAAARYQVLARQGGELGQAAQQRLVQLQGQP